MNGISVLLLAAVQPAPVITFSPPCTPDPNSGTDFPKVQMGASIGCNFYVQNPSSQPISVTVTGNGFVQQGIQSPLNPGGATSFMITFTPVCGTAIYNGSLVVNGQTFALSATGMTPTLAPIINVDSVSVSAQQPTLTLSLPTAAPCGATGYLNLAFTSGVQGVASDSAVKFLQGNVTSLPFSVAQSSTVATSTASPRLHSRPAQPPARSLLRPPKRRWRAIRRQRRPRRFPGHHHHRHRDSLEPDFRTTERNRDRFRQYLFGRDDVIHLFRHVGKAGGMVVSCEFYVVFRGLFRTRYHYHRVSPAGQNSGGTFLMRFRFRFWAIRRRSAQSR